MRLDAPRRGSAPTSDVVPRTRDGELRTTMRHCGGLAAADLLHSVACERLELAGSTLLLWRPAPRLIVSQMTGVLTRQHAAALGNLGRRAQNEVAGKHLGFHDWEHMVDYDTASRVELTKLAVETATRIDRLHILAGNGGPTFAIRAAALLVRHIELYSERATFEARLTAALTDHRRKSSGPPGA
jgi:hypothetical protein